ncbi:MAG: ATP-dependent DNA ligase [uncultured Solirubrobacteraceae bacterium]|uniref:ATP-dependent DNA ligase n=1 Tax=uncultured Solirubrobacteraceae bacterium TaxID=1162706 RepID=A0A6J4TI72_9ACTN|nr:MAG: ATP-dependent DNA ligase [uncultured Solirubrobacteraceae bacterium]
MKLTNLDRVVFPADGITKGDVVAYYEAIAERMLPHLEGRPLSLQRFRSTIDAGGFYQQAASSHFPEFVGRLPVAHSEDGGETVHPLAESQDALVYLANQGALTFHVWPARTPDLEHPDALVLDFDPSGEEFAPVRTAALLLREELDKVGLSGVPMLSGSRGLHVIVPLDGTTGWDGVWTFAKAIGAALVKRAPKELTRAFYKSQRRGRLYVDTGRARRGHTAVAPYTVRANSGAPVAAPVTWAEVEDEATHAQSFTIRTVLERPADPWEGARWRGQSLGDAAAALGVEL